MGHGDNSSLVLLKVGLKPLDTLGIEVVGRLIKEKHIRLTKEKTAKGNTTALTSTECRNLRI